MMHSSIPVVPDARGFDIIGDIHGCAQSLVRLLERLGYEKSQGIYRHPSRQAVFLGDIIDRGPAIRECIHIIRDMVERGSAQMVLGNHELHAIAYERLKGLGASTSDRLIEETKLQFEGLEEEWQSHVAWFQSLPVFLELPGCRVVHACWDGQMIAQFKESFADFSSQDFWQAAMTRGSFISRFLDRLTRGTVLPLPDGRSLNSRDGYVRRFFRTKFWASEPATYRDVVFQPDPLPEDIACRELDSDEKNTLLSYQDHEPPIFIGHYWLSGDPRPLRPNVACLDYSAVKDGKLVAYRFDGEAQITQDKFVWVDVAKEILDDVREYSPL
ncbi:metallophosphoesterase [Pseudoteredinibacter isoporae]|uniref:metallophosphoesterase n=1 Tax=Pseudoteredinibacter isoporae TaxID=570281 RepID=UPI00310C280A